MRFRRQSVRGGQRDIDIAVAAAEAPVGEAADEISPTHLGADERIPVPHQAAGKIARFDRRALVQIGLRAGWHDRLKLRNFNRENHSALRPANFTTLPHFSVSSTTSLANSDGERDRGLSPS